MKLSIVSFTANGIALSLKLSGVLDEMEYALFTKCTSYDKEEQSVSYIEKSIGEWAKDELEERNAILFIGACGIAVRAIAPYITDKLHDSPVLVMDETGRYVIPILSGHVGGANELALYLAERTGAEPVLTTATEINHRFAVDVFAKKNELAIVNKDGIARVSSKVLSGENITMSVQTGHIENKPQNGIELTEYPPITRADVVITSENREFDASLLLRPREYGIGIGCRKGKDLKAVEAFIAKNLKKAGITPIQVAALSSIDLKKEEPALLTWSKKEKIPFITYTAEELRNVEGTFHKSGFVREQVGVDNVCERAAMRFCGPKGSLVYEKHAEDGMTIAIARRDWSVKFDEE